MFRNKFSVFRSFTMTHSNLGVIRTVRLPFGNTLKLQISHRCRSDRRPSLAASFKEPAPVMAAFRFLTSCLLCMWHLWGGEPHPLFARDWQTPPPPGIEPSVWAKLVLAASCKQPDALASDCENFLLQERREARQRRDNGRERRWRTVKKRSETMMGQDIPLVDVKCWFVAHQSEIPISGDVVCLKPPITAGHTAHLWLLMALIFPNYKRGEIVHFSYFEDSTLRFLLFLKV